MVCVPVQCHQGQGRAGPSGGNVSQVNLGELERLSGPSGMEGPPGHLKGLSTPCLAGAARRGVVWVAMRVVALA